MGKLYTHYTHVEKNIVDNIKNYNSSICHRLSINNVNIF